MSNLPARINAMRVMTYDVQTIAEELVHETGLAYEEITIEMVLERIEHWLGEDFGCRYGHQNDISDLIIQDENGNSL